MNDYRPVPIPAHLPDKLTISLWDFSWYVRTGSGEPFEDLDRSVAEAVERGYNAVRICAMPFLLFGSGLDTSALRLDRLGGEYAQRVRWYDVGAPTVIDAREHLLALFRALDAHGLVAVLSSWEYQQSSSFAVERDWFDALMAVPPSERPLRLADAMADLVDYLAMTGLDHCIAFTELHNEVQFTHLVDGLEAAWAEDDGNAAILELKPSLTAALDRFHERHPDRPVTVNYAHVPVGAMRGIPDNVDVLVAHPYIYGVLDETTAAFDLRGSLEAFPREQVDALGLLREGAPAATEWMLPPDSSWKLDATIVGKPEIFFHDWVDPDAFDRFLYERYESHRTEMDRTLADWVAVAADHALARGIPVVFGEGWIGYTPLHGDFEEGPVGAEFCRRAVRASRRVGAWGTIVCSNAAPHHPMWADVALQRECNSLFTEPSVPTLHQ